MPLMISDEELATAGLSESGARLEFACRLYDAGKLSMPAAARMAAVNRTEFEAALLERNLPLIRVDDAYWQQEAESMQRLGWS
jgi:predicted HTH domain antitoxin